MLNSLSTSQPCDCAHSNDLLSLELDPNARLLMDSCRVRAHSMGSQLSAARERLRARLRPTMESELVPNICRIDESIKGEKSNSTPVLANADQHRHRSATVGSRMALLPTSSGGPASIDGSSSHVGDESFDEDDDLMVIDYTKGNLVMESEFNVTNTSSKEPIYTLPEQSPSRDILSTTCEESSST